MREYKGCFIERNAVSGMYVARVSLRYGHMPRVSADTLQGIKQAITDRLNQDGLTRAEDY